MAHGQLARLLSWSHRGFNLDAGQAHLAANDAPGRRRLAEYLLRAPFSLEKITYNPATASVPYRSTPHWPTRRTFEVWTAPNFIATLLAHLPTKGSPQVRYYGWYSNKSRGLRTSAAQASALATADPTTDPATPATTDAPAVPFAAPNPPPRRRRRIAWRELIKHVWGVDPLKCPLCPDQLRPIAVVKKTTEIATLLAALNLPRPHQHPWAHGPPAPTGTVVVDARTGTAYPVDPRPDPRIYCIQKSMTNRSAAAPPSWIRGTTSIRRAARGQAHPSIPRTRLGKQSCLPTTTPSPTPPRANRSSGQSPPAPTTNATPQPTPPSPPEKF